MCDRFAAGHVPRLPPGLVRSRRGCRCAGRPRWRLLCVRLSRVVGRGRRVRLDGEPVGWRRHYLGRRGHAALVLGVRSTAAGFWWVCRLRRLDACSRGGRGAGSWRPAIPRHSAPTAGWFILLIGWSIRGSQHRFWRSCMLIGGWSVCNFK